MTSVSAPPPESRPYQPFGAARDLFYCRDGEIVCEGPAGTGKSRAVLEKLNLCLLKYPGARALIVRKTRASMTQSVLVTFEEKVLPERSGLAEGTRRQFRQSYRYPNGSELVIGGMDNPDRIMSTDFDLIAAFEATELTQDDWEKLTTRLRNGRMPYQQAIADCNPSHEKHWINQRAKGGGITRLLSRHEDNPLLWDRLAKIWTAMGTKYLAVLDKLSGHRFLRLRRGLWASAEGVVFPEFDAAIHVIDPFEIPKDWRRLRSIDFGYQNPFTCGWWALDNDRRMYLYRELYGTRRIVEDWAKEINRLSEGERYEVTVADHDAEDRATLERHGIVTIPAMKAITVGLQAVEARLKKAGDSRPRLMIFRNALVERDPNIPDVQPHCLEDEYDCYVWPKGKDNKPVKEVPEDHDNHGQDQQRYAVAWADNPTLGIDQFRLSEVGKSQGDGGEDERMWQQL